MLCTCCGPIRPYLYTIAANCFVGGLSIFAAILIIAAVNTGPRPMDYNVSDPTFSHVHKSERVPFVATYILSAGLVIPFWIESYKYVARVGLMAWRTTGWIVCILVVNAIVEMTKKMTGRIRPDGSEAVSFPSGHTAVIFVAVFYGYMMIKEHLLQAITTTLYFLIAWSIAMTRLVDNRHHEWDILGGIVVAAITVLCVGPFIQHIIMDIEKRSEQPSPPSPPSTQVQTDLELGHAIVV